MKPSGPGLLFVGRFFITLSISLLVIGMFIFSIFPGSVLEGYTFLRICPYLLGCPFHWHRVACSSSLMMLSVSAVSVVTSPFSFLILFYFILFYFFFFSDCCG